MEHRTREVSIPAEAFEHLRASLVHGAGGEESVRALHAAGLSTGEAVYRLLAGDDGDTLDTLAAPAFWLRLQRHFADRGWGTLDYDTPHPGISVLSSPDWVEAGAGEEGQASCAFTSGVLSYLLTRLAGAPVAVLETACRGRGDDRCQFAFGSQRTIQSLYGLLVEGGELVDALSRLGDTPEPPGTS